MSWFFTDTNWHVCNLEELLLGGSVTQQLRHKNRISGISIIIICDYHGLQHLALKQRGRCNVCLGKARMDLELAVTRNVHRPSISKSRKDLIIWYVISVEYYCFFANALSRLVSFTCRGNHILIISFTITFIIIISDIFAFYESVQSNLNNVLLRVFVLPASGRPRGSMVKSQSWYSFFFSSVIWFQM